MIEETVGTSAIAEWGWLPLFILILVAVIWVGRRLLSDEAPNDIAKVSLEASLDWQNAAPEALETVYGFVIKFADDSISWYQNRRRPKRSRGMFLRSGALFLTAAAGAIPLVGPALEPFIGESEGIAPVWSTILLALAGLAISFDRLEGATSGWIRYMLAQQKVERLREEFLIDWNALKLSNAKADVQLERAKALLVAVARVVDDETQEWATEFQNAIKEMEKVRKEAAELARSGALEVSIKNFADVDGDWMLEIDGSERGRTSGQTIAVTDVQVGIRKLRATGKDQSGRKLSDEGVAEVKGGAILPKELELR